MISSNKMGINVERLPDFYSNWVILWGILWSRFKIGPSPWLPCMFVAVAGIVIEIINWFRNGTPLWFVAFSIIEHCIPFVLDLEEDYNLEALAGSAFLYILFMGDKIENIYDNPYKYLFEK